MILFYTGIYVEIEPPTTGGTSVTAIISSSQNAALIPNFDVNFAVKTNNCQNPTLSVTYEALDFSSGEARETFDVKKSDGTLITNCAGGGQCAEWQTCISAGDVLGTTSISKNSLYTTKIEPYDEFHKFCSGSDYSFYAAVTLNCGGTAGMYHISH